MRPITRDEEIVLFHYTLGVAMLNWASVENVIRTILVTGFKNEMFNREALSVGFFALEGFGARLKFADNVISRKLASMNPDAHGTWKQLAIDARALSGARNKLAHWAIAKYWHRAPGLRVVLSPWVYKKPTRKTKKPVPAEGSLSIREMYRISLQFIALAAALENFSSRILGHAEPHAKSAERAGDPPTADNLAHQIREVFSDQPQPSSPKP